MSGDSPFVVLPFDKASEIAVARLRLAAAIVTGLVAIFVLAQPAPIAAKICAALGGLASMMWIGMWARARRRVARSDGALRLTEDVLVIDDASGSETVRWDDVRAIEVDEERLTVRLDRVASDPLHVEPCFGGLGVYDLERKIARAWRAARGAP